MGWGSSNIIVESNYLQGAGMWIGGENHNIRNNHCMSGADIVVYGRNCTMKTNILENCGITVNMNPYNALHKDRFYSTTHHIDISNMVNGKPVHYIKDQNGGMAPDNAGQVILVNCSNMVVSGLSSPGGIVAQMVYSSNNSVENNTGRICLTYSDNNRIVDNECRNINLSGILLVRSNSNHLVRNSCVNIADTGIYLRDSHENEIRDNLALRCRIGISLSSFIIPPGSNGNRIFNNELIENLIVGVWSSYISNDNFFYHNNFINNTQQANDTGENQWDDGNSKGNYWSGYGGLDNGYGNGTPGDGIGDTFTPHLGLDYYPYMQDWGWYKPPTPFLSLLKWSGGGKFTLTWTWSNVTEYVLEHSNDTAFSNSTLVYRGSNTSFEEEGQRIGVHYYRIKGINGSHVTPWSELLEVEVISSDSDSKADDDEDSLFTTNCITAIVIVIVLVVVFIAEIANSRKKRREEDSNEESDECKKADKGPEDNEDGNENDED
jgi:parallel beta-helix repeat protein